MPDGIDEFDHQFAAVAPGVLSVGGDGPLVDAPPGRDFDVLLNGEQGVQALYLPVGEPVRAGVQGAAGAVERVSGAAPRGRECLLDTAPATVQGVTGEAEHVERIRHRDRVGQLLAGGGLEPGEPVHRNHLDPVEPGLVSLALPPHLLETPAQPVGVVHQPLSCLEPASRHRSVQLR